MHALRVARCLCLVLGSRWRRTRASSAQTARATATSVGCRTTRPSGQQGKDVVWVPTSEKLVETMLDMAQLKADDNVIDLGSGDGRTVIAAAKRGATALGIEYNPDMVALSKTRAAEAGVADRATFAAADLFASDFTKATVITMFLLPDINLRLRPQILDLAPGTRIVSNTFTMGEWEPDRTETITDCVSWCTALLWIVPAKVQGTWQTPDGPLTLEQQFQQGDRAAGEHGDLSRASQRRPDSSSRWATCTTRAVSPAARSRARSAARRSGAWSATRQ